MSKALIQIRGLTKEFPIKKKHLFNKTPVTLTALNRIDLDIYEGEVLGLVGESGCGKSTLGKVILQLLKESSGTVHFGDVEISSLSGDALRLFRKHMQMVFQDPRSALNPNKKIGWLLEEPLRVHGIPKAERMDMIHDMLELVGLSQEHLTRYPSELSGGQAQRVAIMSALIMKPEFIVADEAVSSLDVSIQAQILNLLNELKDRLGLTTLFITHDLSVCYYMSDRIAVMYLGNIVEIGPADKIYYEHQHPYTKLLFSSLLSLNNETDLDERYSDHDEIGSPINIKDECPFYNRCPMREARCLQGLPPLYDLGDHHYSRCIHADKERTAH